MPRKKEGGEGRQKIARESKRRGSRVACKFSLVAGKMSRVRNNPHLLNKLLRELTTFFRIQPCYFYGSQFRDNIQLETSYKAIMDGTGKCGKGPSLLEKEDKATREQISRARQFEEDLIREDLCDADQYLL